LKHEIDGKAFDIASNSLDECASLHVIERRPVHVEHDALRANDVDSTGGCLDRRQFRLDRFLGHAASKRCTFPDRDLLKGADITASRASSSLPLAVIRASPFLPVAGIPPKPTLAWAVVGHKRLLAMPVMSSGRQIIWNWKFAPI
jgi:hypothetical protein